MTWTPPRLPMSDLESRLSYWRAIAAMPDQEPGAKELHEIAESRLAELQQDIDHRSIGPGGF